MSHLPPHALLERLERNRCRPSVIARVMKLNPYGCRVGARPRGMHRRQPLWMAGRVGVAQFIEQRGIEAYRAMDPRWWDRDGLRKSMSKENYLDNVWKFEWTPEPRPFRELKRLVS